MYDDDFEPDPWDEADRRHDMMKELALEQADERRREDPDFTIFMGANTTPRHMPSESPVEGDRLAGLRRALFAPFHAPDIWKAPGVRHGEG